LAPSPSLSSASGHTLILRQIEVPGVLSRGIGGQPRAFSASESDEMAESARILSARQAKYAIVYDQGKAYRWSPVGDIRFSSVEFRYEVVEGLGHPPAPALSPGHPSLPPTLRGLSFFVPAGRHVAIVGPSGAGKTTLLRLLARLADPSSGTIRLDDRDLVRDYAPRSVRRCIGVVEQNPTFFSATVAENIAFGFDPADADAYPTQAQIEAASRLARLHDDVVARLPRGYGTYLPGKAATLSSGERQRLAIARALVRSPAILLLDEATSALDPPTEEAVIRGVASAMSGRTVFSVTHSLSAVLAADAVFMMEGGKIVEAGTHDSLFAAGGRYASFMRPHIDVRVTSLLASSATSLGSAVPAQSGSYEGPRGAGRRGGGAGGAAKLSTLTLPRIASQPVVEGSAGPPPPLSLGVKPSGASSSFASTLASLQQAMIARTATTTAPSTPLLPAARMKFPALDERDGEGETDEDVAEKPVVQVEAKDVAVAAGDAGARPRRGVKGKGKGK
jgi:ABC-type multidrug transport system ATPase subunit